MHLGWAKTHEKLCLAWFRQIQTDFSIGKKFFPVVLPRCMCRYIIHKHIFEAHLHFTCHLAPYIVGNRVNETIKLLAILYTIPIFPQPFHFSIHKFLYSQFELLEGTKSRDPLWGHTDSLFSFNSSKSKEILQHLFNNNKVTDLFCPYMFS